MGRRSKALSSRLANLKGNRNKAQTRNEDRVEEGAEILPEQHADTPDGSWLVEAQMALPDIPFMTFKRFSELEDGVGEVST